MFANSLRTPLLLGASIFDAEALATFAVDAIFTIINLLLMYFVLKRFLYKPILAMMKQRQEKVASDLDDAAQQREEASRRNREAEQQLQDARSEAVRMVGEAKSQARLEADNIVKEAKLEALEQRERSRRDSEHLRRRVLHEVRSEIGDLAMSISSRVIGELVGKEEQRSVVDRILDEKLNEIDQEAPQPTAAQDRA